jgi:hypothetical protein
VQDGLDYTERLDLSGLPELNSESLGWAAYFYAQAGIPVHPLKPGSKEPATPHGFKDASTDLRLVREYWRDHADHNIGLATGHKFDVLDVDIKSGQPGEESLERLRVVGLLVGVWGAAKTPSGGRHLLFLPSGDGNHTNPASGLDFRGIGGYIVAAPSRTVQVLKPNGEIDQYEGAYQWEFVDPYARDQPFKWTAAMEHLHGPAQKPRSTTEYAQPAPTTAKLAGILRKVAETGEGNRQTIGYWAANRLLEARYGPAAWDALEEALRSTGVSEHDVQTALRDRPDGSGRRVHS